VSYSPLEGDIPGSPQGIDTSETALCKLLVASWLTDLKPGEDSIPDV
jgi:hypothetical protein